MTAPGNSALMSLLLAVFVASCGYAAGRLHQRCEMHRGWEQAYRHGYDTATRSVFSLAARLVAPRRPVRASAPVRRRAGDADPVGTSAESAEPARSGAGDGPVRTGRHARRDVGEVTTLRLLPGRMLRAMVGGGATPPAGADTAEPIAGLPVQRCSVDSTTQLILPGSGQS